MNFFGGVLLSLLLSFASCTEAQNTTEVHLKLGQSACHTWPCDNIGRGYYGMMSAFLDASFASSSPDTPRVVVDLVSWNDRYDYTIAKQNTVDFFGKLSVFGMIGVSGSQSSDDSAVVALSNGGMFLAPVSGAQSLRADISPAVVNIRASFYDEIRSIVRYAVDVRGWERSALLRQSDPMGNDCDKMFGIVRDEFDLPLPKIGSVNKVAQDVTGAIDEIMVEPYPQFVIIAAQQRAAVSFIKLATQQHPTAETNFFSLSPSDPYELFAALAEFQVPTQGVHCMVALPSVHNASLPLVKNFNASVMKHFPGQIVGTWAFEGYIAARFFIAAVQKTLAVFGNVSVPNLLDTVYSRNPVWEIDGLTIGPFDGDPGKFCNQGLHEVHMMELGPDGIRETEGSKWPFASCGTPPSKSDRLLLIILSCSIGFFVFVAAAATVVTSVICRRVRKKPKYVALSEISGVDAAEQEASRPFYEACAKEVMSTTHFISHIDHDELQEMTVIGAGSSAKVYRATWRGTYVAVKQLHYQIDLCMDEMVSELANEIKLWSQLMHPYIVQFLGVTKELWLVMEYMEHGPLRTYIKVEKLPMRTKLTLLQHAALALEYIHSLKVVHRDFNPNNIMITGPKDRLEAKLADFGLSRTEQNLKQTMSVGTPVYAAPEVLSHGQFTAKSDVYAFGLTLWFCETEEDPLSTVKNQFELIRAVVMDHQRPPIAACTVLPDLVEWCWQNDPADRPTFDVITFTIHQYLRKDAETKGGVGIAIPALGSASGHTSHTGSPSGSWIAPTPIAVTPRSSLPPDVTDD